MIHQIFLREEFNIGDIKSLEATKRHHYNHAEDLQTIP
jgi:hypothetical protein